MAITRRRPRSNLWAYAYLILPRQTSNRLTTVRTMVAGENAAAERDARIWTGRLVLERRITHLLIVSDSPEQKRGINRRLASELRRLKAEFFLTRPMAIRGYAELIRAPISGVANGR